MWGDQGSLTEVSWQFICSGLEMPHTLALRCDVSTLAPSWIQGLDWCQPNWELDNCLVGQHSVHLSLLPPPAKSPFSMYTGGGRGAGRVCDSCYLSPASSIFKNMTVQQIFLQWWEHCIFAPSIRVATGYMWILSSWDVAYVSEEPIFEFYLNSHIQLLATVLNSAVLEYTRKNVLFRC